MTTRRSFLRRSGLISLSAVAPPAFLTQAASAAEATAKDEKILVVLQLAGGNDGLNTVVPYADDAYHKARPGIAFGKDAVLKIDDHIGLHPSLTGLKELHDAGSLSIVQGVGYPNPNRSHFRSMDIWNSALPGVEVPDDGWLGRALDLRAKDLGGAMPALALGTERLPLALVGSKVNVPLVRDLDAYRLIAGVNGNEARRKALEQTIAERAPAGSDLDFLRRTAASAVRSAARIEEVATSYKPAADYPTTPLGQKLKTVAQLIAGDLDARIFFVSLGGFDTHSDQLNTHAALMNELSSAVAAFFKDLGGQKLADRVLLATYSEFGRRVNENGSLGTDHGTASPLFLAGPGVKKAGACGPHPSLTDLDKEGDMKHGTDFRSVYATLLENWLGFESKPVLGGRFDTLDAI